MLWKGLLHYAGRVEQSPTWHCLIRTQNQDNTGHNPIKQFRFQSRQVSQWFQLNETYSSRVAFNIDMFIFLTIFHIVCVLLSEVIKQFFSIIQWVCA